MLEEILVTQLDQVNVEGGDVYHAMRSDSQGFLGFGEAYFSFIKHGVIKGWKYHNSMTLNLIVPIGKVRFVFSDGKESYRTEDIGNVSYKRLTVPPKIWFGFQGLSKGESIILNLSNIPHDDNEVDKRNLDGFNFNWDNLI